MGITRKRKQPITVNYCATIYRDDYKGGKLFVVCRDRSYDATGHLVWEGENVTEELEEE